MIADYKVVGARYLSELAVADIEHLADYGEPMLAVIGDLAQVQECDQGLGVCSVGIRLVRMAEDDHMVVGGDLELLQGATVRGVAHSGRDLLVSERVEAGRGDRAVGGHHHHLRAGTDVVVELGDYLRRAVVPPEDQGAFGPGLPGWRFSYGPGVDLICLMFGEMYRAVVFGDQNDLVVRGDPAANLRVQHDATILLAQSDHRATLVCCEGFVEGHVDETGFADKVDLILPEVQEVRVDDRETRLAAGLGRDTCDEVIHGDQTQLGASDHLGYPEVRRIADPRYDMVRLLAPVRVVGQGEDGFDHLRVGFRLVGRKHDDRARLARVDDLDIVDVDGISCPANYACSSCLAHPGTDLIFHLDLIRLGEDCDARAPAAFVGFDQFGHDGENLGRPAVDDSVAPLHDERATLAQVRQFLIYAGEYNSDKGAENQDAAGRDGQHRDQVRPASPVSAHVARVYGPHQVEPERLEEARPLAPASRRHTTQVDEQGARQDQCRKHQEEPADQCDGPLRDRIVEPVAQPVGERDLSHAPAHKPPSGRQMDSGLYRYRKAWEADAWRECGRTSPASQAALSGGILHMIISASVDRHDVVLASERFPVPAVPAFHQAQPGDPRHEVEFGRPCVALDDRIQAHPRAGNGHVALVEHLLRRIVAKHIELYCVDFDGLRIDVLVVAQPVEEGG